MPIFEVPDGQRQPSDHTAAAARGGDDPILLLCPFSGVQNMMISHRRSRCKRDVGIQGTWKLPNRKRSWRHLLLQEPLSKRARLFATGAAPWWAKRAHRARCFFVIEDGGAGNLSSRVRLSPKDPRAGSSHLSQKVLPDPDLRFPSSTRPR